MQASKAIRQYYTSSLTRKGQVTIPIAVRRLRGGGANDKVAFVVVEGQVRITPTLSVVERTAGLLASDLPALTPQQEKEAAEEAMAEEQEGKRVESSLEVEAIMLRPAGSLTAQTAGMLAAYRREPALTAEEERAATEQAIAEDVARRMAH